MAEHSAPVSPDDNDLDIAMEMLAEIDGPHSGESARRYLSRPRYVPFPVEVLPRDLARFIKEAAGAIGCDPALVAAPLLSGLAAAVGNTRWISVKPDWSEPCIIWCASIANSGTCKSPAAEKALRPLVEAQKRAFDKYSAAMLNYEVECEAYEQGKRRKSCASTSTAKPKLPVALRYIVVDTTVEALAPILQENLRGLLIARDELSGLLGSLGRYKTGGKAKTADEALYLSMHRGQALTIDRKGTGTVHIPQAVVSIAGNIPPEVFAKCFRDHVSSGLAARFLVVQPPDTPRKWTDRTISQPTAKGLEALYRELLGLGFDEYGAPVHLPLTPEAKQTWIEFFNRHNAALPSGPALAAAWSKLEGYAARLSLLMQLVRHALGETQCSDAVEVESVRAGVALTEWFTNEARRLYGRMAETDQEAEIRELAESVEPVQKRLGVAPKIRDLQMGVWKFRGMTADAIRDQLNKVVEAGRGAWLDEGRIHVYPSTRIGINNIEEFNSESPNDGSMLMLGEKPSANLGAAQ
jgi:hypothetical protein